MRRRGMGRLSTTLATTAVVSTIALGYAQLTRLVVDETAERAAPVAGDETPVLPPPPEKKLAAAEHLAEVPWAAEATHFVRTDRLLLYANDWDLAEDGLSVTAEPIATVFRDPPDVEGGRGPFVVTASSARLRFVSPLSAQEGGAARIGSSILRGPVRLRGADGLRLTVEGDLMYDEAAGKLWSDAPVTIEQGPHRGRGLGCELELFAVGGPEQFETVAVSGVRTARLLRNVRFELSPGGEAGDAGEETPVTISSRGAFTFDVDANRGRFDDRVVVARGEDDAAETLSCDRLDLELAPRDPAAAAARRERVARTLPGRFITEPVDPDLEPRRLVATGQSVVVHSPTRGLTVFATAATYDLTARQIRLTHDRRVRIVRDRTVAACPEVTIAVDDKGVPGEVVGLGAGELRHFAADSDAVRLLARWSDRVVRPTPSEPGREEIRLLGRPRVDGIEPDGSPGPTLEADVLTIVLASSGDVATAETAGGVKPRQLLATGSVRLRSARFAADTETLTVDLVEEAESLAYGSQRRNWRLRERPGVFLGGPDRVRVPEAQAAAQSTWLGLAASALGADPTMGPPVAPRPGRGPGHPRNETSFTQSPSKPNGYPETLSFSPSPLGERGGVRGAQRRPANRPSRTLAFALSDTRFAAATRRPAEVPSSGLRPPSPRGEKARDRNASGGPPAFASVPTEITAARIAPRSPAAEDGPILARADAIFVTAAGDFSDLGGTAEQGEGNGPTALDALREVRAVGNVRVRQDHVDGRPPLDVEGDEIRLVGSGGTRQTVHVTGAPAHLRDGGAHVQADRVHLDRDANRIWVDGPGLIEVPLGEDVAGPGVRHEGRLDVWWAEAMDFDGRTATFAGRVRTVFGDNRLACPKMRVFLDAAVDFGGDLRGETSVPRPGLAGVVCEEGVEIDGFLSQPSDGTDGGPTVEQTGVHHAEFASLVYTHADGRVLAEGPGTLELWQKGEADEAGLGGGPVVAANAPADRAEVGWHYTRVRFVGQLRGFVGDQQATFDRDVRVVTGPVDDPDGRLDADRLPVEAAWLRCGELSLSRHEGAADEAKDEIAPASAGDLLAAGGSAHLELLATGNVEIDGRMRGLRGTPESFFVRGDVVTFDQSKGLYTIRGLEDREALIARDGTGGEAYAKTIWFVPAERKVLLDQISGFSGGP